MASSGLRSLAESRSRPAKRDSNQSERRGARRLFFALVPDASERKQIGPQFAVLRIVWPFFYPRLPPVRCLRADQPCLQPAFVFWCGASAGLCVARCTLTTISISSTDRRA